jgi:hypothetical protein
MILPPNRFIRSSSACTNSVSPLKKNDCWGWKEHTTNDLFLFFLQLDKTGWMFGKLDGRVGIFPADYVEPMSRIEARKISASSSRHNNQQVRRNSYFFFPHLSTFFFFPPLQMP